MAATVIDNIITKNELAAYHNEHMTTGHTFDGNTLNVSTAGVISLTDANGTVRTFTPDSADGVHISGMSVRIATVGEKKYLRFLGDTDLLQVELTQV